MLFIIIVNAIEDEANKNYNQSEYENSINETSNLNDSISVYDEVRAGIVSEQGRAVEHSSITSENDANEVKGGKAVTASFGVYLQIVD